MPIPTDRVLWRAADRIREVLVRRATSAVLPLPKLDWLHCCRLAEQLSRAEALRLPLVRKNLRGRLYCGVEQFRRRLLDLLDIYPAQLPEIPSTREVFDDLRALRNEFDAVKIDFPARVLAVATESIVLQDVELGAFLIQLPWGEDWERFLITALDPNPARCDSSHPHPHVSDHSLCQGDGRPLIRRALRDGRLFDFFVLVRQVLRNYNPGSAYVTLDEWHSEPCAGCAEPTAAEHVAACSRCESHFCPACLNTCPGCHEEFCTGCQVGCAVCGGQTTHCAACIGECDSCQRVVCSDCRSEDTCTDCLNDAPAAVHSDSEAIQVSATS